MKSLLTKLLSAQSLLALSMLVALTTPVLAAESKGPAKPDLALGQEKSTQVCAACHTADGSRGSPANPIIAGQHAEYLVKQLTEFKSGKRANPIMSGMAGPLSEADMRNVAAFYASKQAKPGFAESKDTVLLGEKIYRQAGARLRRLPQPDWRRHPRPVPAPGRPTRRLQRVSARRLPRRHPRQFTADGGDSGQTERQRTQGSLRLHGRPALTSLLAVATGCL